MNNKKIIFAVLGLSLLVGIALLFSYLNKTGQAEKQSGPKDFTLWVVGENAQGYNEIIKDFKSKNTNYAKLNIGVTSFSTYEEYYYSLLGAIVRGNMPDMFVMNNSDNSLLENQTYGVSPEVVSVDEFRKNYEIIFSNDLVKKDSVDGASIEYLKGIPMGYQTLGLFYNFRELRGQKLTTWAYINEAVRLLKSENGQTLLGIGNGTTVRMVGDILAQFFLLDGISNIQNIAGENIKTTLSTYLRFGDVSQDNGYDRLLSDLHANGQNNLDAFNKGDVQMVIGFPSLLKEIDAKGYSKTFLRASHFPTYTENSGKILAQYYYFVISKQTRNLQLSNDLMKYFATPEAQQLYLKQFPFYMPSMLSLVSTRLEENILPNYNIKYKDFFNKNLELTSFNKQNAVIFDKEIPEILDSGINGIELFEKFRKNILCVSNKMNGVMDNSNACEK